MVLVMVVLVMVMVRSTSFVKNPKHEKMTRRALKEGLNESETEMVKNGPNQQFQSSHGAKQYNSEKNGLIRPQWRWWQWQW